MWVSVWDYTQTEANQLYEWAKCGESPISAVPTVLWAAGAAALAQRIVTAIFKKFLFRRVPLWETMLQHLLFIWMVIYSLHFWTIHVRLVKAVVGYCYEQEYQLVPTEDELISIYEDMTEQTIVEQLLIWVCAAVPLAVLFYIRRKPQAPQYMMWITTNPWMRREMGPYGYYLNRPLSLQTPRTSVTTTQPLRKVFSDSKILMPEPPKKSQKKYSKSV